jgi:hypothetical protein
MSKFIPKFNALTSTIYPGVIDSLQLHTLPIGIHSGALVPSAGLTVALNNKDSYRNPSAGPTRPLWRKREVVKQERTVEYTTIDANGVTQVGRAGGGGALLFILLIVLMNDYILYILIITYLCICLYVYVNIISGID